MKLTGLWSNITSYLTFHFSEATAFPPGIQTTSQQELTTTLETTTAEIPMPDPTIPETTAPGINPFFGQRLK